MLKPTSSLILSLADSVSAIESEMSHVLIEAVPGLYSPAGLGVLTIPKKNTRVKRDVAVTGISEQDGRIVIEMPSTVNQVQQRVKNNVGLALSKDFINLSIDKTLRWVEDIPSFSSVIEGYMINPSDTDLAVWCEERIRVVLNDVLAELYSFIGSDNWHIYNTSILNESLRVDKVIDYRIHEYTRLKSLGVI